ncbi:MAG: hypothetical protein GY854_08790 [Deltaproteobacteria bacterium]|nr:hypothetical protein [Deltaproteobacteria bacterium]
MLVIICTGCGSKKAAPSSARDVEEQEASRSKTRVAQPVALNPRSQEAAAATKSRGDAVISSSGLIYRGATAGLIIGEIKDDKFFERSTTYLPGAASDIAVRDGVAFVACGPAGVFVIDVSATTPKILAVVDTPGGAYRLHQSGSLLAIADGTAGVVVVDITNPTKPAPVASWTSNSYVRHVLVDDDTVFAAEDRSGVAVLRLGAGNSLELLARLKTDGRARALHLEGTTLYVADGPGGLLVADVSNPERPRAIGKHALPDMARDVVAIKGYAFVANGDNGLVVLDVSDPIAPSPVSTFVTEMPVNRVQTSDTHLLIGNDSAGLLVVDVAHPEAPTQVFPLVDSDKNKT